MRFFVEWHRKPYWGPFDSSPRVLEPAAGCGNFIRASQFIGVNFDWIANDFYPEGNNWEHNYTEDFLSDDFNPKERFDFIVTNPPFSGKVDYRGLKMDMPMAFIHRSFEFVDKVAMVLPVKLFASILSSFVARKVCRSRCVI